MRKRAENNEGGIGFCGSRSAVVLGFSRLEGGGISSSGIGSSVLVRRRRHRVGKYGRRVQHRVRRRREAMKAMVVVRRTVVRMMVRLRFDWDRLVDAMAVLVGILVAVAGEIAGHCEGTVVVIGEDDEVVELGSTAEDAARVESKIDRMDEDSGKVAVINVNSCDPVDDDSMDTALKVEIIVG